jgi:hypothetical protein
MLKLILTIGIISVLAGCANMSRGSASAGASSRSSSSSSSMGAPAGTGDYGLNDLRPDGTVLRGGPN